MFQSMVRSWGLLLGTINVLLLHFLLMTMNMKLVESIKNDLVAKRKGHSDPL